MLSHFTKIKYFEEQINREIELFIVSNCEDKERVPLIIMHDGQNLFEDETAAFGRSWRLLDQVFAEGFPKCRIVGISNSQIENGRLDEYSPWRFSDDFGINAGFGLEVGGKGFIYLDLIFKKLLPEFKKMFKVSDVYMGGSSMGGFISMVAAIKYPKKLKGVFCMSNAWWFAYEDLTKLLDKSKGQLPKIYLDTGTKESEDALVRKSYRDLHDDIVERLKAKNPAKLISRMFRKAIHNEAEWEKRFTPMIKELLED